MAICELRTVVDRLTEFVKDELEKKEDEVYSKWTVSDSEEEKK